MSENGMTLARADRPLRKVWKRDGGVIPYPRVREFDFIPGIVRDIDDLCDLLREIQSDPCSAIVRADTVTGRSLAKSRRLLHDDPETGEVATLVEVPRSWVAVDLDDLPVFDVDPRDLEQCAEVCLSYLPEAFAESSFIVQATASHGVQPGLSLRVWAFLSRPLRFPELSLWFSQHDHVDISCFRPSQLIMTAPPHFEQGSDPLPERIFFRRANSAVVSVPVSVKVLVSSGSRRFLSPNVDVVWRRAVEDLLSEAVPQKGRRHPALVKYAARLAPYVALGLLREDVVREAAIDAVRRMRKSVREWDQVWEWAVRQET